MNAADKQSNSADIAYWLGVVDALAQALDAFAKTPRGHDQVFSDWYTHNLARAQKRIDELGGKAARGAFSAHRRALEKGAVRGMG